MLIGALKRQQESPFALFLRKKASDDKAGNTEPWRDLRHRSSRLLAYKRATEALLDSSCIWPELFDNFEVTYISSSSKVSNPLNANPQTASDILTRMTFKSVETKRHYLELAKNLQQQSDLDKVIGDEWTSKSFRPIVHAEILLHSWLEKTGGTRPDRFFHNWQYIGCSKPLCKLCNYYFASHPSGVHMRGTHGNLYRNWRMPDNADVSGLRNKEEAVAKRLEITQSMLGRLRECVLRALGDKVVDHRPFDSNTMSSFPHSKGEEYKEYKSEDYTESNVEECKEEWEPMDSYSETGDGVGLGRSSSETARSSPTNY
jgi:hypothetical protein